jgi:hypothetical protein
MKRTNENGQGLVEFALVFPLQLVLVMFILEMSMILVGRSMVSYAAYCAAHAEVMGQDPVQAASLALIPLGDPNAAVVQVVPGQPFQPTGDLLPGWGVQPRWADVRNKIRVYRLEDRMMASSIVNRVNIYQDLDEYHRTLRVNQHNVGVEVEFPMKMLLPLSFFEVFLPVEEVADFRSVEDQVLVEIDGEFYFVLRERCLLPNSDRMINTTLELRDIEPEYEYGQTD